MNLALVILAVVAIVIVEVAYPYFSCIGLLTPAIHGIRLASVIALSVCLFSALCLFSICDIFLILLQWPISSLMDGFRH